MWFITSVLVTVGMLLLALQTESFQTWLARRLTSYLSQELNAKVSVGHVAIRFFDRVALKEVYVEDTQGDTLLWVDDLQVNIGDLSVAEKRLAIDKVVLHDAFFNLLHKKGQEHDNLFFLTDYFSSADTTRTDSAAWKITSSEVELDGFRFRYDDWNEQEEGYGVDFSHLEVTEVSGDIHDLHFINDSIFARLDRLSFKERSGFQVKEFSSDVKVSGDQIRAHALTIVTPLTRLAGELTFDYTDWLDFDDFEHKVNWKGSLSPSHICFKDIAYFTSELAGLEKSIDISGRFSGTVDRFKAKGLELSWGDRSRFKGSVLMTGLPDVDQTYLDARADEAMTNAKDLEWIPLPPFDSSVHISIPSNMKLLGDVRFKGKFTGFFSDFVAYGNFSTGIGYVNSDLNLKYDDKHDTYSYKGHLATKDFDMGIITLTPGLGATTLDIDVEGKGLRLNDINARMSGHIGSMILKGYDYHQIDVEGKIAKRRFDGAVSVHQEDIDLDFSGEIDLGGKIPVFDFEAVIGRMDLNRLNLIQSEDPVVLKTSVSSHLVGAKIDELEGQVDVKDAFIQVASKMYHLNHVGLDAMNLPLARRRLDFSSDLVDAHVEGTFRLEALPAAFREIVPRYLPNVLLPVKGDNVRQDFGFSIDFKNMALLTENFLPDLVIDPGTVLKGRIDGSSSSFDIALETPELKYGATRWSDLSTRITTLDTGMSISMKADTFYYSASGYVPRYSLEGTAASNKIRFHLQLADIDGQSNRLDWTGHFYFRSYKDFDVAIDASDLMIDGQAWEIDHGNLVTYDTNGVTVRDLSIHHGLERLALHGRIATDTAAVLDIDINGFSLSHLDPALKSSGLRLAGVLDGDVSVKDVFSSVFVNSAVSVNRLVVNGDTLGDMRLATGYDRSEKSISVDAEVMNGSVKIMDIEGQYRLDTKENSLDFRVRTDNLYLHAFESFTDDVVKDLRGKVTADFKVTGTPEKPDVDGFADLRKASATVTYLNTRYNLTSRVSLHDNIIDLDGVIVYDQYGHQAAVKGGIRHRYFSDFVFDIELFPKNLEVINTNIIQNSLYYGKAFATGYGKFSGTLDDFQMDIALSPGKGTVINIPLNTASEVTAADFISFVNPNTITEFEENTNVINLSGLRLNMSLDMNADAEINLIFDEKIGDVISGSGSGNIRMDINTIGDFNMYGTYVIEKGTYLFTLQNLINKRFQIDPGGRITWGGDPYDAMLDMTAVYTVSTSSLYNLIQDSTFQRRVPVDCRLNLSNKLMNPTINYEIAVRAQDATIESMVRTVLNSEQEVNRQMFGLLVFNQFLPPSVSSASNARIDAGAGAVASASELLSNQVSNWLSQLSKDVNIGFNYRAKDTYSNEEIQLMFSKSMFNDRLLVETNVGVTGNTAAAASTNTNSLVGEFYTEYKVSKDGRFRLKAYNRSNADDLINFNAPYTQGVGVFFRQDFNSIKDLKERLGLTKKPDTTTLEGDVKK